MSCRHLALESGGISSFLSPWEWGNVDIWRGGWRAWIPNTPAQRFALKWSFILGCWFWNTVSKKWRVLLSLRNSISDSLETYQHHQINLHSFIWGWCQFATVWNGAPSSAFPRCERRRRVGGAAQECVGPHSWPGMCSLVLPLIDELGRVRWRVAFAFCLGSSFILARNSIYLFIEVQDR